MSKILYTDHPLVLKNRDDYIDITVDAAAVVESWRLSLMSFEWLDFQGRLKAPEEMPETERQKRLAVEQKIKNNEAVIKAILGIGLQDNVEIGSGRAEFLTLASQNEKYIQVHVKQSQNKEFKPFLAK